MRRIQFKLTMKTPAWPRLSLLCNVAYILAIYLTLNTINVMYQYIVQFRKVRVATTQIISTIKHISFYYVSHQSHLKVCHQHKLATHLHKTFNFSDKGIPSVWKPQIKLELKNSGDIHWDNFELRKSWLDYLIFVSFFVLDVYKNRVLFLGFGSGSGFSF